MERRHSFRLVGIAIFAAALALVATPRRAEAQEPDIREIRPIVMMLVDTSGSMEYELNSSSGTAGTFPTCTGNGSAGSEYSRWTALLAAMTGSFENYWCTERPRASFPGSPDEHYALPYHEPHGLTQRTDGVLDIYIDRVKFGLMTYDNIFGLDIGAPSNLLMVAPATWTARASDVVGPLGDFSYGPARPVSFPGCGGSFMVNAGARREHAPPEPTFGGSLISVGTDTDNHRVINQLVQNAMLAARPFGATPTAALLDDFLYYLQTDPDVAASTMSTSGDPYASCRERYAILITDGEPSDPYRAMGCAGAGYTCPYRVPGDIANDLCQWNGSECTGLVDGLYVVGYEVNNPASAVLLNDIASRGGTGTAYVADANAPYALLASLSHVLDDVATGTTTRTTPAFAEGSALFSTGASAPQQRYQLTSGFLVGRDGAPWTGILDRTRFTCTGASTPPARQPLDPNVDSFHTILNARSAARVLYTAVTTVPGDSTGVLVGALATTHAISGRSASESLGSVPYASGVGLTRFEPTVAAVTPAHLAITTGTATDRTNRRTAVMNWMHGTATSPRATARLGDIYHSSPVTVAPPRADIADESYNAFRRRTEVAERPTVLYVGTNDGILHAFAVEEHRVVSGPSAGRVVTAGEELWGFIPPALLGRLESATAAHQFMVDATPVVRDMFYARSTGDLPSSSLYHTTLVAGLRGGGNVYVALDVSDPLASAGPGFLWQFRRDDMGLTYGRPALAQVYVDAGGGVQQRGVAILPGGMGTIDAPASSAAGAAGCPVGSSSVPTSPPAGTGARTAHRCWSGNVGRSLYVVDLATGVIIRSFHAADGIGSPITGGVSVYTGDVGTIATRAYVTDDDGLLWRLDMANPNPALWTFLPIHDLYWNDGPTHGHTSTEPPVITTDANDDVVVIVGTGDLDDLEGNERYHVVSMTDAIRRTPTVTTYTTTINWDLRLQDGEQVTGPLELFDSRVYFGTFLASAGTDACQYGGSRLWGLHYLTTVSTAPTGYSAVGSRFPAPGLQAVAGTGPYDTFFNDVGANSIVMGVGVTRTPTCVEGTTLPDPYLTNRFRVSASGGGDFRLTAAVSGARPSVGGGLAVSGGLAGETSIVTITSSLETPPSVTRVTDWAGSADY